jgi:ubiquitin-protein ligase
MSEFKTVTLSSETVKRLIKDVRDIMKNPLTDHGIHYIHSETDVLHGQVMIVGPRDTPYDNGYYFFDIKYPPTYPHTPPLVTYCTNDGQTRFNPNLYKCGKVCISVLNTWKGEQWTACQSISSILLVLCTVLNSKPLLNEPGVTKDHRDYVAYDEIIRFRNYEIAIAGMLESEYIQTSFAAFTLIMKQDYAENYEHVMTEIDKLASRPVKVLKTGLYNMCAKVDYSTVRSNLERIYQSLEN